MSKNRNGDQHKGKARNQKRRASANKKKTKKPARPKYTDNKSLPQNDWWIALKNVKNEISKGWLADISGTILGGFPVAAIAAYVMTFSAGPIIALGIDAVYIIWVVIILVIRHYPSPISIKGKRKFIVCGLVLTLFVGAVVLSVVKFFPPSESEFSGKLIPANDPNPTLRSNCFPKIPDPFAVYFGGSVAYTNYPIVTIVSIAGTTLLSVSRKANEIEVAAKIFSEDGRIIAEIINNEFTINRNNYFKRVRPDRSTLIIYDQKNAEVLNLRYLNPSAIKVNGIFQYQGRQTVTLKEDKMLIGKISTSGACLNNPLGIVYIE